MTRINPDVRIDYRSDGSESGLQQILSGQIDFALTEVPLTPTQLSEASTPLEQFPLTAGPVCMVYNLPGLVFPLKLTPETLAGIYLGEITEWNDDLIARDNPNVELPHTTILTVHDAHPSGTTNIFTHYLTAASRQWAEEAGAGEHVKWPAQGRSGDGNEGIAQAVTHVAGGIGYVECGYATQNKLPIARIQNQSGRYVDPTAAGVTAAVQSFAAQMAQNPFLLPVNSTDPAAYPMVGVSYIVFPQAVMKRRDLQPLLGFLDWALNQGQSMAAAVNYAPLPADLLQKQLKELDRNPSVPLSADLLFGVRPDDDRAVFLPKPKKLPKRPALIETEPEPHAIGKNG